MILYGHIEPPIRLLWALSLTGWCLGRLVIYWWS